jgi:hypothetical protein
MEQFASSQFVPQEHDDRSVRIYCKWEGRCPAANDCMHKAWPKLKKQLWQYGGDGEAVRDMVLNHLTASTYHQLSNADAERCIDQVQADSSPLMQYEETYDEREAYRIWKKDVGNKIEDSQGTGKDIASALRGSTKLGRKKPGTLMFREAINAIEESAGDVDGYDLLDAVAKMADAGELVQSAAVRDRRKRRSRSRDRPSGSALEKRRKLNISLDADDLKSIGHVLVRAKSDAVAMKIEAANLKATASVLESNFGRHEVLIGQCQDDLTRIISQACTNAKKKGD